MNPVAHIWDLRLVALGLAAAAYLYMVRGPTHELPKKALAGKVCLITGCNTGIGLAAAEKMARAGAQVIFACRSEAKAREAMKQVLKAAEGVVLEEQLTFICPLDLGSSKSIRSFATKFRLLASMRNLKLHYLILNAGAMFSSRSLSEDGIEMTVAANHIGHFLLTNLLLPQLRSLEKAGGEGVPRIVIVGSSHSYAYNAFDFSEVVAAGVKTGLDRDEFLARPYEMFHAYGQTKLANLLFANELAHRLEQDGSRMKVCVVHPGSINTEIARDIPEALYRVYRFLLPVCVAFLKTTYQGCTNTVYAATAADIAGGSDGKAAGFLYIDRLAARKPNEAGFDRSAAKKLWALSEQLTSLTSKEVFGSSGD